MAAASIPCGFSDDKAAAAAAPIVRGVIPLGDAWLRAMASGVADPNPYDGIEAGKLDLRTYDGYHASTYGYYLQALAVFGAIAGHDLRSLGDNECAAFELGLSTAQAAALQQVAIEELASRGTVKPNPLEPTNAGRPTKCPRGTDPTATCLETATPCLRA